MASNIIEIRVDEFDPMTRKEEDHTMKTITCSQINRLLAEAGAAGDLEQVAICERALAGDTAAIAECARVIDAAQAQIDWCWALA